VADLAGRGRRVPGFGHRQHRHRDPRLDRLFALAARWGWPATTSPPPPPSRLRSPARWDDRCPSTSTAPWPRCWARSASPAISATPCSSPPGSTGILAHANEERQTMRPMRRVDPVGHAYQARPRRLAADPAGQPRPSRHEPHPTAPDRGRAARSPTSRRRGVRHVFGLCGHTNIAVLAAMAGSPHRVRQRPPRAGRRPTPPTATPGSPGVAGVGA
jgi:hypothetical protein